MSKENTNNPTASKKWIIVILSIITLYLISLFTPFINPYTKYPLYYAKCGGQPVIGEELKNNKYYFTPGSPLYKLYPTATTFFCSEEEAIQAGYKK